MSNPIVVFGSSGMLGSQVVLELQKLMTPWGPVVALDKDKFDASKAGTAEIIALLRSLGSCEGSYIVNCVGLTKNRINSKQLSDKLAAISTNSVWPIRLAEAAEILNLRVIQPATDCVYSGSRGLYDETDPHDPNDLYGKTKSIGEVDSEVVMHLRSSFIGRQKPNKPNMLFEWVNNLESGSQVRGFTNHYWNGVTVNLMAKAFAGVIEQQIFYPGVTHLVPKNILTKLALIELILDFLGRTDVEVLPFEDEYEVDRSLSTRFLERNELLFSLAGYNESPTVEQVLEISGI